MFNIKLKISENINKCYDLLSKINKYIDSNNTKYIEIIEDINSKYSLEIFIIKNDTENKCYQFIIIDKSYMLLKKNELILLLDNYENNKEYKTTILLYNIKYFFKNEYKSHKDSILKSTFFNKNPDNNITNYWSKEGLNKYLTKILLDHNIDYKYIDGEDNMIRFISKFTENMFTIQKKTFLNDNSNYYYNKKRPNYLTIANGELRNSLNSQFLYILLISIPGISHLKAWSIVKHFKSIYNIINTEADNNFQNLKNKLKLINLNKTDTKISDKLINRIISTITSNNRDFNIINI